MSFPAYPLYQDSGVEWLGEVPSHWTVTGLKRAFSIAGGSTPKSDVEDFWNGDIPWITPGDLSKLSTKFISDTARMITDSGLASCAASLNPAGSIVISTRAPIGSLAITEIDASTNQGCKTLVVKDGVSAVFGYYALSIATEQLNVRGRGSTFLEISADDLGAFALPFPPQSEQVAIAAFLDRETTKIDALIEQQRRLIALLKEKRQAVISHAVTKGLDRQALMKDSGIEWLGEVPAHWEVKRLRFICHIGTGDADTADAVEDGAYPFFVRSPVIERIGDFSHDCEAVLTAGDGAGVGKVYHYFKGKFRAHQRVYIFSQFRGVLGRFFYAYMSEMFAKAVLEGTAKSTVESLRRPMIADFWMTVPPDGEQGEIIGHIEAASAKFDALSNEADAAIRLLNERRAALISAAVTGKIDVRGSAKVLPFPIERARARRFVATEIIERLAHQPTFGRTKLQKVAYLAEAHASITELVGCYIRMPYGPLDQAMMDEIEANGGDDGIVIDDKHDGSMVRYRATGKKGRNTADLRKWLGDDRYAKLDRLIEVLSGLKTHSAEAIATLYAVWNDALIEGRSPTDEQIISAFFGWHPKKGENFSPDELPHWLDWMRRHGIVPTGSGPKTMGQIGTLL